jgi:hypothetical protein
MIPIGDQLTQSLGIALAIADDLNDQLTQHGDNSTQMRLAQNDDMVRRPESGHVTRRSACPLSAQ